MHGSCRLILTAAVKHRCHAILFYDSLGQWLTPLRIAHAQLMFAESGHFLPLCPLLWCGQCQRSQVFLDISGFVIEYAQGTV